MAADRERPGVARIELDGTAREFVGELTVDADVGAVALADAQVVPPASGSLAYDGSIAIARWNILAGDLEIAAARLPTEPAQDAVVRSKLFVGRPRCARFARARGSTGRDARGDLVLERE